MRWRRIGLRALLVAALTCVLAVLAAGVAGRAEGASGANVVVANVSSIQKLDPQVATKFIDIKALGLIYDTLVRYDQKLDVVPGLAKSWSFSKNATALTLNLRSGVKFADGSDLTSADVKASFERVLNPKTGAAASSYLAGVKTIATPNPQTVVLHLKHPDVSILAGLTSVNLAILPKAAIDAGTIAQKPDGTGPFQFVSWNPSSDLVLQANPSYWGGKVKLQQVTFRVIPTEQSIAAAVRAGTVQIGILEQPQVVKQLQGANGIGMQKVLALSYDALMIQSTDPKSPLHDVNARLALQCAIDRNEVVKAATFGQAKVVGPVPQGPFASDPNARPCPKRSVAKAKAYLKKAGMPNGYSFTAMISDDLDPTSSAQAQSVQAQLASVGIKMQIQETAGNDYVQRWLKGKFQAAFARNGANPDPFIMYGRYFAKGANLAIPAGYSSTRLADLLTNADRTPDKQARKRLYDKAYAELQGNAVWIWLFDNYEYYAVRSDVHGFKPLSTGSLLSLASTTLKS